MFLFLLPGVFFITFQVPETKGKSLAELNELFRSTEPVKVWAVNEWWVEDIKKLKDFVKKIKINLLEKGQKILS